MEDKYEKFERTFTPVEGSPLSGSPVYGADYVSTASTAFGYSADPTFAPPKPDPVLPKSKLPVVPLAAILVGIFLIAYAFMAYSGSVTMASDRTLQYVPYESEEGRSVLFDVYLLSDPFYEMADGYKLYLAFDEDYYCAVVGLQDEDYDRQLQAINEYTFSDAEEGPGVMTLTGRSVEIPYSATSYAVEYYNSLYQEDVIYNDGVDYQNYMGTMLLLYDPRQTLPVSVDVGGIGALIGGGLILFIGGLICFMRDKKRFRKMTETGEYAI